MREAGARVRFISDGDIAGAISAARDNFDTDVLMGIGGTPEGITAACALKCTGGAIQAKLWPRDDQEREKALAGGHDLDRVLYTDDLVTGDNCFFVATGVTSGELLRGVHYRSGDGLHAVDRDAVEVRDDPGHRLLPQAGEARPLLTCRLRGRADRQRRRTSQRRSAGRRRVAAWRDEPVADA